MRTALLFGALLLLAPGASAQERKVWTDADLAKPLPHIQRPPEPEAVAGLKRRADYIPNFGGGRRAASGEASVSGAELRELESYYSRELAGLRAKAAAIAAPPAQPLYASQPLYPYATVIYSNGPLMHRHPAPAPHRRR